MNIYLQSVGCRLNRSEIEVLAQQCAAAGHRVVADPAQSDTCLVNTCAVTSEAERKSCRLIAALTRANPQLRLAITGCYATLAPEHCTTLPGVNWVIPNADKESALEIIGDARPMSRAEPREKTPGPLHTRAFVKVQDGCDNHCTYCIVRRLRGPSRSQPIASVVADVQARVGAGCKEVVLTGVCLGAYGQDLEPATSLVDLIKALLTHTDLSRLRLSSLEPWDLEETFFHLWENPRLCRQLHIPLQSGCDETLRRMGRRITTARFTHLVETASAAIPDLAVTTDLIVGFPGEDNAAFRRSYDFVAALPLARLHIFPYSARPGTAAMHLTNQVPRHVCQERARAMRALGKEQAQRFRRLFVGREMDVLWERRRQGSLRTGLTGNYLRVAIRADEDLHNQITATRLLSVQNGVIIGEISP